MEWKTIDSAPKDGTWILGWRYSKYIEDQIQAWRWRTEQFNVQISGWMNATDTCDFEDDWPTHWMTIPEGPK